MRAILVTGGAGFIGSHTCKAHARAGYLPVAYDDLSRDGTCVRDYVHVDDFTRGDSVSSAINLGTEQGNSLMEMIRSVQRVTGRNIAIEFAPLRAGHPAYPVAEARRAAAVLGWTPTYTEIDRIVERAWSWMCRGVPSEKSGCEVAGAP